jgi:hypothetical protein
MTQTYTVRELGRTAWGEAKSLREALKLRREARNCGFRAVIIRDADLAIVNVAPYGRRWTTWTTRLVRLLTTQKMTVRTSGIRRQARRPRC